MRKPTQQLSRCEQPMFIKARHRIVYNNDPLRKRGVLIQRSKEKR